MKPESDRLDDYLVADDVVDWREPEVLARARGLAEGLHGDVEIARRLFEWVRDEIPHTKSIGGEVVTCSASEVLRHRTGICFAKSHLLAAMLRANGIPAGFCYQVLLRDARYGGHAAHGLNGIYLRSLNRWIRVDPRGNTKGINAQFGIDKEQLAFAMDEKAGEFIYDIIFKSPAPIVVKTLRGFTSVSEMWPHLPSAID